MSMYLGTIVKVKKMGGLCVDDPYIIYKKMYLKLEKCSLINPTSTQGPVLTITQSAHFDTSSANLNYLVAEQLYVRYGKWAAKSCG